MRFIPHLVLVAVVIALDQWSKAAIAAHFHFAESMEVTSFFNLVLVYNTGAAFSFLSDASGWQRPFFIAITVAAVALIGWMICRHQRDLLFSWGLTFILAGAVGNLIDRIVLGHVIDFLDFHTPSWHFWAFNLADSAITLGAGMLILDSFRTKKS